MASNVKIWKFSDFTKIAVGFYATLGFEEFNINATYSGFRKFIQIVIFNLGTWNLILTIVGELIYLKLAFGAFENFLQITALLPCIGVCVGTIGKIMTVWNHKDKLTRCLRQLEDMFPKTIAEQADYEIATYIKHVPEVMVPCTVVPMTAVWVFSLYDMFESLINYFLGYKFVKSYPYFVWYPFDSQTDWIYPIIYLHQTYAGYMAVGGSMATDLLVCCVVNQLRMHFDYISRQLVKLVPTGVPSDTWHLKRLVKHHITILRISNEVNNVFGLSILYNFVSSSLIICLTGFQVLTGLSNKDLIKYLLFLLYQLVTVFMLCYHGHILIEASLGVGDAAYNQQWFKADKKYKKILFSLLTRAKKPAILNATSFSVVSLVAFNKIMSNSYQFFALLRSMYNK